MKCPSCMRPVDHEADSCYSCGYSLVASMAKYGGNYVQMSRVHDAAHCLRKQDRDELNQTLDTLEMRFPQMLFCLYLGALPKGMSLSELGFWLLNRAQVKGAEYARPNDNAALLVMDIHTKQIGLSLGYFTEMLVTEEEAYRVLMAARPYLVNGEFAAGLCQLFRKLGRVLEKKAKQLRKKSVEEFHAEYLKRNTRRLDLPEHVTPTILQQQKPVPAEKAAHVA